MNQLLVISDSHSMTSELKEISQRHDQIPYKVHCGDSELNEDSTYLEDYATVAGNCDWNGKFPNEIEFDIDQLHIYVTHGHLYGVKYSLSELVERAKSVGANIACSGHSHIAFAEVHDGILLINPGSIRLPKGRIEKTYAIVSWDDRSAVKVDFYDIEGKLVDDILKNNIFSL